MSLSRAWKWPFDTACAPSRSCPVITQIAGARQYLQRGEEILLKPGDSTIIDTAVPWSSSCNTDCVRLYLRVPRWVMQNRLCMHQILLGFGSSMVWSGNGVTFFAWQVNIPNQPHESWVSRPHQREDPCSIPLNVRLESEEIVEFCRCRRRCRFDFDPSNQGFHVTRCPYPRQALVAGSRPHCL
jgi:hypothetical protein